LIAGTAGLAIITIPSAYYFLRPLNYDPNIANPGELTSIIDSVTIDSLGINYLWHAPDEKSERKLVSRIMGELNMEDNKLRDRLTEKIKQDFKTGNTVIIDGWLLSVTEARQCALTSILNQNS